MKSNIILLIETTITAHILIWAAPILVMFVAWEPVTNTALFAIERLSIAFSLILYAIVLLHYDGDASKAI
jgi:hypothetical protein